MLSFVFVILINLNSVEIQEKDTSQYAVFYEVEFRSDSTDLDYVSKDIMVLYVGDNVSKFRNFYQIQRDSLTQLAIDRNMDIDKVLPFINQVQKPKMTYAIIKDWENKVYEYSDLIFPDHFIFESSLNGNTWEVLDEFEEYEGHKVQKAITHHGGRVWEAWFSAEIPINDGPYVFGNLPGLILKIKDSKNHYSFQMIKIEKKNEVLTHKTRKKPIKTTRPKFFEMQHDFNTNIIGKMASGGVTLTDANQGREAQKRFDRKNNPLELKVDDD
jgi:GLPGLI family protein